MANIMIRVKKEGVGVEEFKKDIKFKFKNVSEGLTQLAYATRDTMRSTIEGNKRRGEGSGRLERAIDVHVESRNIRKTVIGVGSIELLDTMAPHWYIINYGGMVSPLAQRVPGYFGNYNPPMRELRGWLGHEPFYYTPMEASADRGNTFLMVVKTPITPKHYIEKAKLWLNTVIKVHFYNWTGKTQIHTMKGISEVLNR